MASTASSAKTNFDTLRAPSLRSYYLALPTLFGHPTLRPPVLDEMLPDINRMVASCAQRYADNTCAQLAFDELVAEGNYKLAQLIDRGELVRQKNRSNFFRFFKASVLNHFRSLVQRHRFTFKRTGHKPPPKHGALEAYEAPDPSERKQVELSLDDEESGLQVSDAHTDSSPLRELIDDYLTLLNPLEQLVFREIAEPSPKTRLLAYMDAHVARTPGSIRIVVKDAHRSSALGLSEELYAATVLSIRRKIRVHEAMTEDAIDHKARRGAIVQQLANAFGVQVPASTEDIVVRRLFTVAARDQYRKVLDNEQLAELLVEIGAKLPKETGNDMLACFGVLYKASDRRCCACDLRQSCAVQAANQGLGDEDGITLSPRLLGGRGTRYPVILPSAPVPAVESADTSGMDVLSFLDNSFTHVKRGDLLFYIHHPHGAATSSVRKLLFCVERSSPLVLRFCNPSAALKTQLKNVGKGWYPSDNMPADQLIELIEQHSSEVYMLEEEACHA